MPIWIETALSRRMMEHTEATGHQIALSTVQLLKDIMQIYRGSAPQWFDHRPKVAH